MTRTINSSFLKSLINRKRGYRRTVARFANCSDSTIEQMINNRYKANPSEGLCRDIAEALGVDVDLVFPFKKENL